LAQLGGASNVGSCECTVAIGVRTSIPRPRYPTANLCNAILPRVEDPSVIMFRHDGFGSAVHCLIRSRTSFFQRGNTFVNTATQE